MTIEVYISHSIRGIKEVNATLADMEANNQRALAFGLELRRLFPKVNFYIPAEGDEFVLIAYTKKILTEKQILDVDCEILDKRHVLLDFIPDQYISAGMLRENLHAQTTGKPILMATNIAQARCALNSYLERAKR